MESEVRTRYTRVGKVQSSMRMAKGLGVLSMVFIHALVWVLPRAEYVSLQHLFPYRWLGPLMAVGFFALTLPALFAQELSRLPQTRGTAKQIALWGVFLLVLGVSVNAIVFPPQFWNQWDVLLFSGVCCWVLACLLWWLPRGFFLPLSLVLILGSSPLRELLALPYGWQTILTGHSHTYWPLFPWVGFFLLGYWVGDVRDRQFSWWDRRRLIFGGVLCVLGGLLFPSSWRYLVELQVWGASLYLPPAGLALAIFGGHVLVFSLADLSLWKRLGVFYRGLAALGDSALVVYLAHLFVGYPLGKWVSAHFGIWRVFVFPVMLMVLMLVVAKAFSFSKRRTLRLQVRQVP